MPYFESMEKFNNLLNWKNLGFGLHFDMNYYALNFFVEQRNQIGENDRQNSGKMKCMTLRG